MVIPAQYEYRNPRVPVTPTEQNIVVVGTSSSGKYRYVEDLLLALYGPGVQRRKEVEYSISGGTNNNSKVKVTQSNFHLVVNPSVSSVDKYVIQEVIVEFAKRKDHFFFRSNTTLKLVVVLRADQLSEQAQFCLRRVVEDESATCRFVLVCSSTSNVPLLSRFVQICLPTATREETRGYLEAVREKEGLSVEPGALEPFAAERNVTEGLWFLQSVKFGVPFEVYWKANVRKLVDAVFSQGTSRTARCVTDVRDVMTQLFVSNLDTDVLVVFFLREVLGRGLRADKALRVCEVFSTYDVRIKNATRYILHIEALVNNLAHVVSS